MQDPRRPTQNQYAVQYQQYPQQLPHDVPYLQDEYYVQKPKYNQPRACATNPYQREYAHQGSSSYAPSPAGYHQTHTPVMNQMPMHEARYEEYQPRYHQELPLRVNPYQPQYAPAAMPGMELVTSTVEKSYAGSQKSSPMVQQLPVRDCSPPPAYSRETNNRGSPHSSNSTSPASALGPTMRPATSMGQFADGYKLVAIPATSAKLGSPFLRAYPPALHNYGISREAFMRFVDQLNRAAVASPPVQVLGLVGNIVSMVPLHTAQIVGNAVNAAATVSTIVVSKGRTEMLLREANASLFKEAGLKVQVAKLDVVAKLAKIPILNAEGKVDKKSSILLPFEEGEEVQSLNAQERRVRALSTWLSRLEVEELPELDESTNMFGKMHAKVSERQREKEEKKMMKDRQKMHKDYVKDKSKEDREYEEKMGRYAAKESKLQDKGGRRVEKELRDLEKKREKLTKEHDREIRKIEKDRRKDDKEEESMRKILFLVIQKI
ncbi:hypothetical protein NLG97_g2057 [Lecanicillium saksenae]|uniref:Uncharacterized protein n=1 Tax=Lecanicillium saksenae TaxID=468837 RepID=A0ACC1R4L6_9HYPO|nr:hypothetical protein NLG97_g2057 [Lecanicillium saksenae]